MGDLKSDMHAASSADEEWRGPAPFFICGVPRSGTTVLARLLGAHPRLAIPLETGLFRDYYPLVKLYGDLADPANKRRIVKDILTYSNIKDFKPSLTVESVLAEVKTDDFGGIFAAIMSSWTSSVGKLHWGEKTPQHKYRWDEINRYFPNAKVIFIIRDGRDVTASLIRSPFGQATVYGGARRWVKDLQQMERICDILDESRFIKVRYEDLLADTETTLKELCAFLDEPFDTGMLNFYDSDEKTAIYNDPINLANLRKPLMEENSGKWVGDWNDKDIYIFEALARDYLIKYGYPSVHDEVRLGRLEHLGQLVRNFVHKAYSTMKNKESQRYYLTLFILRLSLMIRGR